MKHNSNRLKEYSLNSISSIDNNMESTKYINLKSDSINRLLSDIGTIRGRRKSYIISGRFKNQFLNDMVSFSSLNSNFINNRRHSYFNFRYSRYNTTKNITSQDEFNIPITLNK